MKIELRDCKIAGLPEAEIKESEDFRFRRRELLRCTTEKAAWGDRRAAMTEALTILKNKNQSGNISLNPTEAATIRRALENYQAVDDHFTQAGINSRGLLDVIDEAGKLYRGRDRSAAAMKIGWTAGKRRKVLPYQDIFVNYLLLTKHSDPPVSKTEAVKILRQRFDLNSEAAVKQSLKQTAAELRPIYPDLAGILPSNWEKAEKRFKV